MAKQLNVGSWPGPTDEGNEYISLFCKSLTEAGVSITDIRYPRESLGKKLDVLHIHWPEQVFWNVRHPVVGVLRAISALAIFVILRMQGVKLVWCVHNVEPHDASRELQLFWKFYAGIISYLISGFITLSPSTVEVARNHFSGLALKPATFIWHPAYPNDCSPIDRVKWRERHKVNMSTTLFTFIGAVRPYKGVEELISSFSQTTDPRLSLAVVGDADKKILTSLKRIKGQDSRVLLDFRRVSKQELVATTLAADVIVLPFRRTLHSGSIIFALSCGRPVITPATAFANDLRVRLGPRWVQTYEPPLSPKLFVTLCSFWRRDEHPDLDFLSLYTNGLKLKKFYQLLCLNKGTAEIRG